MQSLYSLINDIKTIINSIEVKYESKGKSYESLDTLKLGQSYVSAKNQIDSFATYYKFDVVALNGAGIVDPALVALCIKDKYNIPQTKRNLVVTLQRKFIVDNYYEYNNYYRSLWGLPDINDSTFIYIDLGIALTYNINPLTPIHELSVSEIYTLESIGYLDQLKIANPTKKYLNFLGEHRIDPSISRTAKNFSILKVTKNIEFSTLLSKFLNIYEACREYFMSVIYVAEFAINYDHYDGFIGMLIMTMTLQRFFANIFKSGINRDFFDIEMVRNFFASYNVPFFDKLPYDYQINLIKNLNKLLQYKSTNKVLFDLASLLDFPSMSIYEYFIIKEHKLDIDNKPLFFYKDIDDGNGGTITVLDKELMYDFYFQRVSLKEPNLAGALLDSTNRVDYNEITLDDPLWYEDENLRQKLYDEEFAFAESKYMGLNIIYRLPKMLFEVNYFFRMIIEKKDQLNNTNTNILLPKIAADTEVRLFDAVILLATLLCKKNGLTGNIFINPSQLMTVYGFNFQEDFNVIRQFILDNPKYVNPIVLDYFVNLNILIPSDVNRIYSIIRDFNDFATERLALTTDIHEYRAYQKLFRALMVCEENQETFRKNDTTIAVTYSEYLQDLNPALGDFVTNVNVDDISSYMLHIINRINKFVTELRYLYIINNDGNIFLEALTALILFFKSYTVDLLANSMIFLFDSRYYNMFKSMNVLKLISKELLLKDEVLTDYTDIIKSMEHRFMIKNKIDTHDTAARYKAFSKKDTSYVYDKNRIEVTHMPKDLISESFNIITSIDSHIMSKEKINLSDSIKIIYEIEP